MFRTSLLRDLSVAFERILHELLIAELNTFGLLSRNHMKGSYKKDPGTGVFQ